jgi:RND family efflux transporter MFP subunit
MTVQSKALDYIVTAPGTLDAFEHVQVTARVAGAVDRVAFSEGQQVKKGDVLVVIDSERYQLAVNSAKAALAKTQAAQSDSEAMVARREGASESHPGLIMGEELATYRTKVLTAKADTQVAQEALKTAEVNLRDAFVRAPMAGLIQTRTVETGQYVQAGYTMATLLRNDPMLLRFNVEPADAPRIKQGMTASFTMRETQRTFRAKITLTAGSADATTHLVPVTAEVTDDEHRYWLRPGSFCDVTVDVGGTRESPVVPRTAVRATDHGYVAYVVDGDTAHERALTLGMNTKDGWVEVRSGLKATERLVVQGAQPLVEGSKVRVEKTPLQDGGASAPVQAPEAMSVHRAATPPEAKP